MRKNFTTQFFKKAIITLGVCMPIFSHAALLKILSSEADTVVTEVTDPMNKKELGKTPLTLNDFDTSAPRVLLLEKPGYAPVYIPFSQNVATHFAVKADMHPLINWTSEELNRKTTENAEAIIDKVTAIQAMLDSRKVKEALTMADALKNEYPNSFSIRLVYANALLLNGEGQKAETLYSTLLSEVPSNRAYLKDSIEQIHSRLTGKKSPGKSGGKL